MKKIVAVPLSEQQDPTCKKLFGVSLQELQQQGLTKDGVPTVVRSIVEYLVRHGLTREGLFRVNGSVKAVEQLRWRLESGARVELGPGDVCTAASLLKLFLRELPGGLVPAALRPRLLQLCGDGRGDAQENSLRDLIRELPDTHYCLLKYLCRFLTKVAKHHAQNRMNVHNLATVFGPNFFHVPSGLEGMKEQDLCNKMVAKILENYNTLFEVEYTENNNWRYEKQARFIIEASCKNSGPILLTKGLEREISKSSPKAKIPKSQSEGSLQAYRALQPELPDSVPQIVLRLSRRKARLDDMNSAEDGGGAKWVTRLASFLYLCDENRIICSNI